MARIQLATSSLLAARRRQSVAGAAGDTCGDWTSTSGNGQGGFPPLSDSSWWVGGGHFSCANTIFPPVKLYCLRPAGTDAVGAVPAIDVTPQTLDFGATFAGQSAAPQTVTI